MKNKIISLAIMTASLFTMTGCLDMEPVSSITDKNMWESEGQFTSFVYGVHSRLRENCVQIFIILLPDGQERVIKWRRLLLIY